MDKILILIHTEQDNTLPRAAFEALNAGQQIAADLKVPYVVGLVGGAHQSVAEQLTGCGAEKILVVSGASYSQARYATDTAAIEAIYKAMQSVTLVLAPASSRWSRVLSGISFRLGGKIDTHVTGYQVSGDSLQIERWFYRQRMLAKVSREERPWFITLDPGVFTPWQPASGASPVEPIEVKLEPDLQRTEVIGVKAPSADDQTIRPEAELIFVAGAGWTKKQADGQIHIDDAEKIIKGFINQAQASLGSSKSLVDLSGEGQAVLSFLSHLNQVGQTGATPRHPKGLATCCHGEEPHVVGWRFITERRAVNLDANCGWAHGKTDVLYIADAFQVMTRVNELLTK